MHLISITIQLLFILQIVLIIDGLFFSKTKKSARHLIAAKYDQAMPKPVRKVLEKEGDNPIIKIQLGRTPVQAALTFFLNMMSKGKFKKKKLELGYDEIYHNYLLITILNSQKPDVLFNVITQDNESFGSTTYALEKAQRIRLRKPHYPDDFEDVYDIPLTPNKTLTLNRLITTASNVDKHFYSYDAADNNMCQTFVENIVDLNGLTPNIVDNATRLALKPQDARTLIETLGTRKDVVKKITDLGGKIDKWIYDNDIKFKRPPIKEFALVGNMHLKVNEKTAIRSPNDEEILSNDGHTVVLNGTVDIVVENADDVFDAVQALETSDTKPNETSSAITIIAIVLGIIGFIIVTSAIAYFLWQKRQNKFKQTRLIDNTIDETNSDLDRNETTSEDSEL